MDIQKLLSLISKDESSKLDFKEKINIETESSKKELAKDICAIANSKGGRGYLIFGIEDKTKKIIGINKDDFIEEKIQQIVSTRIDPPIPISVETHTIDNKTIGLIVIYNTEQKPYQIRETGAFYIRRGSTTDFMRKDEIASMLQENGLISIELTPVLRATVKDLDFEKIEKYFSSIGMNTSIDNHLLLASGILTREKEANEFHPSIGGLLIFGKKPEIFLPNSVAIIKNYVNNEMPKFHMSTGTIIEMLDDASDFIRKTLKCEDIILNVVDEYLAKATVYRDYFSLKGCVEIYLFNNKVEIINPGAAIKSTNNDKYIKRNLWLYTKLISIDVNNKYFNKDVSKSQFEKNYGKIRTYNILSSNLFKVIIPTKKIK
ncbi:Divergent AAA domain protein [Caloramator mitchellensis]|uniref:Divergent AAA domain protein n=1 Tax=Caloramator mitchellensis TaxID=908809 RepID=A0A0R3JWP4_CALMK|nr:RNA-binding domain-containing protein [Caloramator mitchellensis]KRQ87953.1 Divergent AAA domain protein [Caloramator mitchellensis]